jgi:hypothetical protein
MDKEGGEALQQLDQELAGGKTRPDDGAHDTTLEAELCCDAQYKKLADSVKAFCI